MGTSSRYDCSTCCGGVAVNLIDAVVTNVIEKKQFTETDDWAEPGRVHDIFVVEYEDMGGYGKKELWFDADEHKDIQPGYMFLH